MFTCVHVGTEGESAVLDVEGEAEDLQVAGAHEPEHAVVADVSRVIDVHVGAGLGDVIVHTDTGRQRAAHTHTDTISPKNNISSPAYYTSSHKCLSFTQEVLLPCVQ